MVHVRLPRRGRAPALPIALAALGSVLGTLGGCGDEDKSPEARVPPQRLEIDAAAACPGRHADQGPGPGWNHGFEVAGQARSFWMVEPDPTFRGPRPLLVAFNGTSGDGKQFVESAQLETFARRGFRVVAPSSNGNGSVWPVWDAMRRRGEDGPNPDLELFDRLVDCVAAHHPVDRHRIYIAGHSAGGIMANYVLQRRSDRVAGAIIASGAFFLTGEPGAAPLDETFALITWGGERDLYSGGSGGDDRVVVPSMNFVEQASLASRFYAAQPEVGQVNCVADVGHAWLVGLNDWMATVLLEHPKGLPGAETLRLPEVPVSSGATCKTDPFVFQSDKMVSCDPAPALPDCQAACQFLGDCAIEKESVRGALGADLLTSFGFTGPGNTECSGCLGACTAGAVGADDAQVLSCLAQAQEERACEQEGVSLPLVEVLTQCCTGRTSSGFCTDICRKTATNSVARGVLANICTPLLGDG
jgi:poly(3-hydroxybutyrate) depolymerase